MKYDHVNNSKYFVWYTISIEYSMCCMETTAMDTCISNNEPWKEIYIKPVTSLW